MLFSSVCLEPHRGHSCVRGVSSMDPPFVYAGRALTVPYISTRHMGFGYSPFLMFGVRAGSKMCPEEEGTGSPLPGGELLR